MKKDIWLVTIIAKSIKNGENTNTKGSSNLISITEVAGQTNSIVNAGMLHTRAESLNG